VCHWHRGQSSFNGQRARPGWTFFGSPDDDTQEKRELPQALRGHLYKAFSDRGRALA
jgi:hypothetical protein